MSQINPVHAGLRTHSVFEKKSGTSEPVKFTRNTTSIDTAAKDKNSGSSEMLARQLQYVLPKPGKYDFEFTGAVAGEFGIRGPATLMRSPNGRIDIQGPDNRSLTIENGIITRAYEHVLPPANNGRPLPAVAPGSLGFWLSPTNRQEYVNADIHALLSAARKATPSQ